MSSVRTARHVAAAAALAALVMAVAAATAGAVIQPAVTIDGPSSEIVAFGNVAMAADGSGGLVYLKRVDGIAHVFVARYVKRRWGAPVEIDAEDPYPATDPFIGAASSGELVVVWATPFASVNEKTIYHLVSSELAPGSEEFSQPIVVDRNIGTADEASPDFAMSSGGAGYLVYRVVQQTQGSRTSVPLLRPSDVVEEVRVARFSGQRWVDMGAINHDRGVSMRAPTGANAPKVAVAGSSSGVVVWQEPEVNGIARIWARRLFGSTTEYPMQVSATSFHGAPIDTDAEAPEVALSKLGQAEVAYRQSAGPGSPLPGPRIFVNVLPDGESESGAAFKGAEVVDPSLPGGEAATVGRPAIDVDEQRSMRLLYDADGSARIVEGNDRQSISDALELTSPFTGSSLLAANELSPVSVVNPDGGGVTAWPSADATGAPAVAVEEDFPDGALQTALIGGSGGGPIGRIAAGRSGLGDALVAFQQGPVGDASIVADAISAPPTSVVAATPPGWIKPSQARVEWTTASSANGPLLYTVVLDGRRLRTPEGVQEMTLPTDLPDGVHHVQILVTDASGQATLSAPSPLHIGTPAPAVSVRSADAGHGVGVRVSAHGRRLLVRSVEIDFGDGARSNAVAAVVHRYARPGRYLVVVRARTQAGTSTVTRREVSVS